MLNEEFVDNGVKETRPFGNKFVMECYLKSEPERRGYRKRMHDIWRTVRIYLK